MKRARRRTQSPIRVALIEEDRLASHVLVDLLDRQPDIEVVATAPPAAAVLDEIHAAKPHVALVNADLGPNGSQVWLDLVKRSAPQARVVVINVPVRDGHHPFAAVGADALIRKDAGPEDLVHTIRSMVRGTVGAPA